MFEPDSLRLFALLLAGGVAICSSLMQTHDAEGKRTGWAYVSAAAAALTVVISLLTIKAESNARKAEFEAKLREKHRLSDSSFELDLTAKTTGYEREEYLEKAPDVLGLRFRGDDGLEVTFRLVGEDDFVTTGGYSRGGFPMFERLYQTAKVTFSSGTAGEHAYTWDLDGVEFRNYDQLRGSFGTVDGALGQNKWSLEYKLRVGDKVFMADPEGLPRRVRFVLDGLSKEELSAEPQ